MNCQTENLSLVDVYLPCDFVCFFNPRVIWRRIISWCSSEQMWLILSRYFSIEPFHVCQPKQREGRHRWRCDAGLHLKFQIPPRFHLETISFSASPAQNIPDTDTSPFDVVGNFFEINEQQVKRWNFTNCAILNRKVLMVWIQENPERVEVIFDAFKKCCCTLEVYFRKLLKQKIWRSHEAAFVWYLGLTIFFIQMSVQIN